MNVCALGSPPVILRSKSLPFIITGPLKVIWQICNLVYVLLYRTEPAQWLLVQVRIPLLEPSLIMKIKP